MDHKITPSLLTFPFFEGREKGKGQQHCRTKGGTLSIYLSIYLSIFLSIYLPTYYIHISIGLNSTRQNIIISIILLEIGS